MDYSKHENYYYTLLHDEYQQQQNSSRYFADLITYGAIGARTVESQPHRKLTSGLSMPTGMKNATNGGIKVAVDGILSAHHPHFFDSITEHGTYALFRTR